MDTAKAVARAMRQMVGVARQTDCTTDGILAALNIMEAQLAAARDQTTNITIRGRLEELRVQARKHTKTVIGLDVPGTVELWEDAQRPGDYIIRYTDGDTYEFSVTRYGDMLEDAEVELAVICKHANGDVVQANTAQGRDILRYHHLALERRQ